ncbi:hypothetical protein CLIB1423_06S01728 [[Candida] railenensis]|uniref:Uncharacterized protein n=1 Tax=[Candida] railenensis TaxID=45579 RepID=A0A9P0QNZ9_9ASCO|nr:hypothetical protein CLIB1423_06S01728 [[Candida] railenensis]
MVPNSSSKRKNSGMATSHSNTMSNGASGTISSPVSPEEEDVAEELHHSNQNVQPQVSHSHGSHFAHIQAMQTPAHNVSNPSPNNMVEPIFSHYGTPLANGQNISTSMAVSAPTPLNSSYSKSASSDLEKKIVQSLSLSKKLNFVLSNFEKISYLQSKDISKIQLIASNFNSLLPSDMNLSKPLDNYYLSWNIFNKFKLPIIDTLSSEIDEFIESFSNSSSISLITKFYTKFNEYTNELHFSALDNQKILNIECKICLLYAILSIGAAIYNDGQDCVQLFMKSWNLLLTNLIPRLNDNTKSVDSLTDAENPTSSIPLSSDIIKDQIQILKNLFTLAYVCFNLDSNLKEISANTLNGDLIFNYLDDISYIIMSHLEENNNVNNYNLNKEKSSRSSSSSSLNSAARVHMEQSPAPLSATVSEGDISEAASSFSTSADGKIIDENLNLFWSIYILLSNYFMINNHAPPKIYRYLLNKKLTGNETLMNIMENLTKSTVANDSNFNNEIISLTLSNELQSYIHYNEMFLYKSKSILHNSIIFTNRSLNDLAIGSNNSNNSSGDDHYVFEMFKKKMIVNSPTKYQGLLNSYIFYPSQNFNWNLLYISLKEFNLENYMTCNDVTNNGRGTIYSKFKFNDFFQKFFHDFDIKLDVEIDIENNDQFKKDQYLQFIKNLLPFFTKTFNTEGNKDDCSDFDGSEGGFEMKKSFVEVLNRNSIINNNLGISSLPILFNYQFIKLNPELMKWSNSSKLNNFEKKRFNYLLIEWYLTIIKLIIGLKNDSNVYVKRKGHQHYRSSSQDSVESMTSNASSSSGSSRNNSDNEYSLSNNYIFQCLIYIIKEVGGKFKLPNGNYYQLRDFEDCLNFENDEFKMNDDIIYCILKNLDIILEDWISMVNINSQDIFQSNGFRNMKKFVNEYIYSQLYLAKGMNENTNYYKIPHRNSVNADGITMNSDNYVLDGQDPKGPRQLESVKLASNSQTSTMTMKSQIQPSYLYQQNVYQPITAPSQVHLVQPHHMVQHIPYSHSSPPQQHHGQPQISRLHSQQQSQQHSQQPQSQQFHQFSQQNIGQQTQTQNLQQLPSSLHDRRSFKEVILPPILPPLSNQYSYKEQLHHQSRFQFPKRQEAVNKQ